MTVASSGRRLLQRHCIGERNGQGIGRRAHPRFHSRAIGTHVHAASGMARRRRGQGRARGRGRHHARPAARHSGRGQPLFHDAEPQQALDHRRRQESEGQGGARGAGQEVRRAGRELRAGRARPDGPHVGAHPGAQPADDRRVGQGLRPGTVRGLQGVRERRAMRGRLGVHHGLRRRPAAGHRRADRRLRNGPASRARHRRGALSAQHERPRPEGAGRDAGRRAQPVPREAARPAAARRARR